MTEKARTQVGIIGAGPAGLVLGQLLHLRGIDSVVLEARDRDYVEKRIRAGVLEQGTVGLLREMGVADRLDREGIVHTGIELRFQGTSHRIAFDELTGKGITIYGQQEVVKDLIAARLASGAALQFEVTDVTLDDLTSDHPIIRYGHQGTEYELHCDLIAGCDGFHGVSRDSVPTGELSFYERDYPFGWAGILAEVAPSTDELIYAYSPRGFALHSLRSPELSRLYVQCDATDTVEDWPDGRVWEELHLRLRKEGWELTEGPVIEKSVTPMRSFVTEPMQYGRLYLAGDAVHIVPATGAKGLNLAVADVRILAHAMHEWFSKGTSAALDSYSVRCLRRVWRAQHFSWWMSSMLHRFAGEDEGFQERLQLAQLEYLISSPSQQKSLAENYVGFDLA